MKKTLSIIGIIYTALFLVFLAGCDRKDKVATPTDVTSESSSVSPDEAPVFMLEKLPEIGGYVDDIIYNRRYPDKRETLTPGENYGKLIPFVGVFRDFYYSEHNDEGGTDEGTFALKKYGIMNDKGEVIIDAVYPGYEFTPLDNGDYIIKIGNFVFNSNGSMVKQLSDSVDPDFTSYDIGFIVVTDNSNFDFTTYSGTKNTVVYDTGWNMLFELDGYAPCYNNSFAEGYMVVRRTDGSENTDMFFVDTEGNFVFEDVHPTNNFENGKVIAKKDNYYGVFTSEGNWIIPPEHERLDKYDNYYVALFERIYILYDLDGTLLDTIQRPPTEDSYLESHGENLFFVDHNYDKILDRTFSEFYRYPSFDRIVCNETGDAAYSRIHDTGYFYCDNGQSTYIFDYDGNTVAKLDGVGEIEKLDEEYFVLHEGSRFDTVHNYTVYSLKDFKKLWSYKNEDPDIVIRFWKEPSADYITVSFVPKENIDDYAARNLGNIVDARTGKIIFEGYYELEFFITGGKPWLSLSDGTYTYTYSPDMTLLMKVRNEKND